MFAIASHRTMLGFVAAHSIWLCMTAAQVQAEDNRAGTLAPVQVADLSGGCESARNVIQGLAAGNGGEMNANGVRQLGYEPEGANGGRYVHNLHANTSSHSDLIVDELEAIPAGADEGISAVLSAQAQHAINQAHASCFDQDPFPSAAKCQQCHPDHYREWSVSPHAYAQVSPVFNAMSSKLNELLNGTLGDFCIRCHTPVGMAINEPRVMSNIDRHPSAREGVTCVVCHRINQNWGKISGRQSLVVGGITEPVYGPLGNQAVEQVLSDPEQYGSLTVDPHNTERARGIHKESVPFFAISTSAFCGTCHDVFAPNGFRLEDAFSEYKTSPAARVKLQSCQDCHMGKVQGAACGFDHGPAAKVGNVYTPPRKRTNHMMMGPDHTVIHPGMFPHNPKAIRETHPSTSQDLNPGLATIREWLQFDHEAGWGTPEFENGLSDADHDHFPTAWQDQARRYRARDILNDQFKLLEEAQAARYQVLSIGYQMGQIELAKCDSKGIQFRVKVFNGTDGHGVPTGFDAERLVFLRTTVCDSNGKVVFMSGDLDPNGDIRDSHSFYVHNGLLPIDRQIFSLQTRFVTRNIRGGEREQVLNVPFSLDPLPYIRPETRPYTVLGRPLGARKHKQNLEVNGHRWANYHIKPEQLTGCGPYHCSIQLIAGMVPINLVHEISSVGFDYHLSAKEIAERIVEGHTVLHSRSAVFKVR